MGLFFREKSEHFHPDYEVVKDLIGPLEDLNLDLKIDLAKYKRAYEAVIQLHRSLNSVLVVRSLLDSVASLFFIESAAVIRFEAGNKLRVLDCRNVGKGTVKTMLAQMKAMIEETRLTRRPVIVADALKEKNPNFVSRDLPSIALIPMILGHEAIGTILISNWAEGAFSGAILDVLNLIASSAAVALRNAEIYESTKKWTFIDPDTETYNRRYFEDYLRHSIDQGNLCSMNTSVLMIGLRNFREPENAIRRLHTTAILRQIAVELNRRIEKPHILCRYNTSALSIIFPCTDESALSALRTDVEHVLDDGLEADLWAKREVMVSGFVIPASLKSPKKITRLADRVLSLQAKRIDSATLPPPGRAFG